ncbi:MAG: OmpA family protein [Deltaproteobacteria bacterium]|nr:OmpA family protein [Deltaproteobacteria bacterium]
MRPNHPWQKTMIAFLLLVLASGCASHSPRPETPPSKTGETPEVIIRLIRDPVRTRPQHQMVLLPNAEGRTGRLIVRTSGGTQTMDRPYLATEITSPDAAPSPPAEMSPETVQRIFGAALSALPDSAVHILLYFQGTSSVLIPESTEMIPKIISVIEQRRSSDIGIAGHADRTGSESVNLKLSRERAESVRRLLTDAGIPSEHLDVHFFGDKLPLIPTPNRVSEPRNRRVEVIIR